MHLLLLEQNLAGTLDHVWHDAVKLILGSAHVARLGMHAMKMDCVESALGGAHAAAYAAVLVHHGRAAGEATGGLLANLLFGKRIVILAERIFARRDARILAGRIVV